MNESNQMIDQPWFRNPMVWMVIALPATAVIAGIITIIIAANTEDGLVVDDYYKQGLAINEVINHDRKAAELGMSAFVDINAQSGEIMVSLSADKTFNPPLEINFKLIHRTRSGEDQVTTLMRSGDSTDYRGFLKPPVIQGRWTIHLQADNDWRLKQDFTTRTAEHIIMNVTSR